MIEQAPDPGDKLIIKMALAGLVTAPLYLLVRYNSAACTIFWRLSDYGADGVGHWRWPIATAGAVIGATYFPYALECWAAFFGCG